MKKSSDPAEASPGPRDHLVTRRLERELRHLAAEVLDESPLDSAEAPERLARHVMDELRRELAADEDPSDGAGRPGQRAPRGSHSRQLRRRGCSSRLGFCAGSRDGRRWVTSLPLPPLPGDAVQPERSAGQRRGSAEHRLRAPGRARDRGLGRSDLRVRDLVRRAPPARGARAVIDARRSGPRDHDDVHGRDREARGRRARRAGRRRAGRVRRAHDQAAREGVAARAQRRG